MPGAAIGAPGGWLLVLTTAARGPVARAGSRGGREPLPSGLRDTFVPGAISGTIGVRPSGRPDPLT